MRAVTTSSIARPTAATHRATRNRAIERPRGGRVARARERVVANGLFGLGLPEIVVIGGVAAVLFGPSKLPELGKSLGKTVKSFQEAAKVRATRGWG